MQSSQSLLREKVAQLPLAPGVYLYKDAAAKVIYVGKAKILRARVRSYFNEDKLSDAKTGSLISEARDIDYILVDNEKEALRSRSRTISSSSTSRVSTSCCAMTRPIHTSN
jgi:excinuclease ABC subunit C